MTRDLLFPTRLALALGALSLGHCSPVSTTPACLTNFNTQLGRLCRTDGDCGEGLFCSAGPSTSLCVPAYPCTSSANCATHTICGQATACQSDARGGMACLPSAPPTPDGGSNDGAVLGDGSAPGDGSVGVAAAPGQLDLLVMVDNSGSMAQNQLNFLAQLGPMLAQLSAPGCVMPGDPTGNEVACSTAGSVPRFPAVTDLHVGIVSSDLGAPGPVGAPRVPGCLGDMGNDVLGDDGVMDPIATGPGEASHLPWNYIVNELGHPLTAEPSANLGSCSTDRTSAAAYPPFLSFCSATTGCVGAHDATMFSAQLRCNAALSAGGCGLESQLESPYRALTARSGAGQPNDGFLREGALLAILVLTDEEDGSVRDDARSVYDSRSMDWAPTTNLNLRFYLYDAPGSTADPTWNPDRYVNPRDPSQGLLALKPGHPERIVFAAIAGAPMTLPLRAGSTTADERIDWDQLLGPAGSAGIDDWYGRHHDQALHTTTPQGPISMRHNDRDTACPMRSSGTIPACYREGQPESCDTYFAAPSRRVLEVARRFDESLLCNGQPCHNGVVRSICAADFTGAMGSIVRRIQARMPVAR